MGLREHLDVLRRRWLTVVVVTVLGVLFTGMVSVLATPTYIATARLFFSLDSGHTANELAQGATFTRDQMASYAMLTTTPAVLDRVITHLHLDTDVRTLAGQISPTSADGTVILDVAVSDTSPERAARIANAVTAALIDVVAEVGPRGDQAQPTVRATVVTPAVAPKSPSAPKVRLNLAAGLVAGLLLGVVLAQLRQALDTRVRGLRELRALTDAPVLGQLTADTEASDGYPVVHARPRSPQAELYRQLATNAQFLQVAGQPLSIVVTSSLPAEGKSTVAVNLALALAEVSDSVLLVDADLRRPTVAGWLGIEGGAGLSTVLVGRASFDDVVQEWGTRGLSVLTAGAIPPNPTQLLSSEAMTALAAEIAKRYQVVIYDSAPLLPVTDALVLSRSADGVVLVGNSRKVRRPQFHESLDTLRRVDARLLGVVLNMLDARDRPGAYGYAATAGLEAAPQEVGTTAAAPHG